MSYANLALTRDVIESRPCYHSPEDTHYLYLGDDGIKNTCSCMDVCMDKTDFTDDFLCVDCGVDTSSVTGIREYYMVKSAYWWHAKGPCCGMLCIGCLEERLLGLRLTKHHFIDAPINLGFFPMSDRLKDRLAS